MSKSNKITIDLNDVITLNINIVYSNGIPALQFRKIVSACDKNMPHIKSILKRALDSDTEIIMPIRLQIVNKPLAIGKLKQVGIHLDSNDKCSSSSKENQVAGLQA